VRLQLSGNGIAALAERKGCRLVRKKGNKRAYQSTKDPGLVIVVQATDWPLPEDQARDLLTALGVTDEDLERWFPPKA